MALADSVQEAEFLKQLCVDLYIIQNNDGVLLKTDNQGAINLAKKPYVPQEIKTC